MAQRLLKTNDLPLFLRKILLFLWKHLTPMGWNKTRENKRRAAKRKQVFDRYSKQFDDALNPDSIRRAKEALKRKRANKRGSNIHTGGLVLSDADVFDENSRLVGDFEDEKD